jgi:hypothetical protein
VPVTSNVLSLISRLTRSKGYTFGTCSRRRWPLEFSSHLLSRRITTEKRYKCKKHCQLGNLRSVVPRSYDGGKEFDYFAKKRFPANIGKSSAVKLAQ